MHLKSLQDEIQYVVWAVTHTFLKVFPTEHPYLRKSIIICHMIWLWCVRRRPELVLKIIRQFQDTRESMFMFDLLFKSFIKRHCLISPHVSYHHELNIFRFELVVKQNKHLDDGTLESGEWLIHKKISVALINGHIMVLWSGRSLIPFIYSHRQCEVSHFYGSDQHEMLQLNHQYNRWTSGNTSLHNTYSSVMWPMTGER